MNHLNVGDHSLKMPWMFGILALNLLSLCAVALAQSGNATLSGVVKDEQGRLIANADVTATNPATGIQRGAQSDDEGNVVIVQRPRHRQSLVRRLAAFGHYVHQFGRTD